MDNIFEQVRTERAAQDDKWGVQNHAPGGWLEILGEEYGEACKASLEHRFGNKPISEYRAELIQVAAVAIAAVECLDRHRVNAGGIYLAGPIKGCNGPEVHGWRSHAKEMLKHFCIDPAGRRDFSNSDCHDCINEIVNPDKNEIDSCAVLLANCWQTSVGTSQEILYAWERGKLVVSVVPEGSPVSAWIVAHSHVIFYSLQDACNYINAL